MGELGRGIHFAAAGHSPLTSMSLQSRSSLNSALRNASSAAESFQSEEEEERRASESEGAEEQEQALPANENGWKTGEDGKTVNGSAGQLRGEGSGLSTLLSITGSLAMEDFSGGDEAESSSECEPFKASELQLIEDALRSLRSVEEGKMEASKAVEHNSNDLQDLQDVARLLKKVQAVKARNKETPLKPVSSSPDRSVGQGPPAGESFEPADIRQVVQAAAQTALAAAKTAETVVSSLNRNSRAMEELCKALTNSNSLPTPSDEIVDQDEEDENETSRMMSIELQQTEIAKSLIRQNRMTHWVLGFIVVSSLVWRYGVVKFVKKVNNTIQNPFQGITDMFKPKEVQENEPNHGLQLKLPFTGEEEASEQKSKAETEKEKQQFDLGKIFTGQESQKANKQSKDSNKRAFDLGSIYSNLPGRGPQSD